MPAARGANHLADRFKLLVYLPDPRVQCGVGPQWPTVGIVGVNKSEQVVGCDAVGAGLADALDNAPLAGGEANALG